MSNIALYQSLKKLGLPDAPTFYKSFYGKVLKFGIFCLIIYLGSRLFKALKSEKLLVVEYPTIGATITIERAKVLANKLFIAFDYWSGTDLSVLNSVYKDIDDNPMNLRLVYNAFGTKGYSVTGTPWFGNGTPTDLRGWLDNELAGSDWTKWETLLNVAGIS